MLYLSYGTLVSGYLLLGLIDFLVLHDCYRLRDNVAHFFSSNDILGVSCLPVSLHIVGVLCFLKSSICTDCKIHTKEAFMQSAVTS